MEIAELAAFWQARLGLLHRIQFTADGGLLASLRIF